MNASAHFRQRGFTILELTIVTLVIVILAAIAIPSVGHWLKEYRLGMAARQIGDELQATKMQAVAKSRKRELLFDVAQSRFGQEGTTLQPLPTGVTFSLGKVTVAPEKGVAMPGPVTFPSANGDEYLRSAAFTGKGLPDADPGEVFAVFLSNDVGTRAVTMTSAGNVRIREWTGSAWK